MTMADKCKDTKAENIHKTEIQKNEYTTKQIPKI